MIVNYVTGLSIGLSIGHKLYGLFQNESRHTETSEGFVLLHTLPGRRRYKHKCLVGNQDLADVWQAQMLRLPQVRRVTMNIQLGTFLIEYICPEAHIDRLLKCLSSLSQTPDSTESSDGVKQKQNSLGQVGLRIRRFFVRVNQYLWQATGQQWDLATLCAVFFSVVGAHKMMTLRQFPSGPQLLWWAFGLLKGRHGLC